MNDLTRTAVDDPHGVDLDDLHARLTDGAVEGDERVSHLKVLRHVAAERDDVGGRFVPPIVALLDHPDRGAEPFLLRCLQDLAANDPAGALEASDTVRGYVEVAPTDEVDAALGCCVELVRADTDPFVDLAPTLAALVDLDADEIARNAVYLLGQLAKEHPQEIAPHVGALAEEVPTLPAFHRTNALLALGMASRAMDGVEPVVDAAQAVIDADEVAVRSNATALLADVSCDRPDLVDPRLVAERLDDRDEQVRINAATVLIHVAEDAPDRCDDTVDPLLELLDDHDVAARRNACKALGHIGSIDAYDALQAKAMFDPDQGVRNRAGWAMERIL